MKSFSFVWGAQDIVHDGLLHTPFVRKLYLFEKLLKLGFEHLLEVNWCLNQCLHDPVRLKLTKFFILDAFKGVDVLEHSHDA